MSDRQLRTTFDQYMSAFNRFEHLPMPVVVAVQGLCFGGGLELAIRADLIIAGVTSRFGHPSRPWASSLSWAVSTAWLSGPAAPSRPNGR